VEFMAALKQSGLAPDISEKIALTGLQNRFFSKPAWNLTLMVNAAKRKNISDKNISSTVMEIVMGTKNVREGQTDLGLDPRDIEHGLQLSGSHLDTPEKGDEKSAAVEGKGGPGESGGSGGPGGPDGSGGSGGGNGGGRR
jgi:hypothetical protein